jgi:hypothetical protein
MRNTSAMMVGLRRRCHLIFDRASTFNDYLVKTIKSFGIEPTLTSFQSPWQNTVAERCVGSCRRELLDHVIVLNERHLNRLMNEYISYHYGDRTHLGLDKQTQLVAPQRRIGRRMRRSYPFRDSAVYTIDTNWLLESSMQLIINFIGTPVEEVCSANCGGALTGALPLRDDPPPIPKWPPNHRLQRSSATLTVNARVR